MRSPPRWNVAMSPAGFSSSPTNSVPITPRSPGRDLPGRTRAPLQVAAASVITWMRNFIVVEVANAGSRRGRWYRETARPRPPQTIRGQYWSRISLLARGSACSPRHLPRHRSWPTDRPSCTETAWSISTNASRARGRRGRRDRRGSRRATICAAAVDCFLTSAGDTASAGGAGGDPAEADDRDPLVCHLDLGG